MWSLSILSILKAVFRRVNPKTTKARMKRMFGEKVSRYPNMATEENASFPCS